MLDDRSTICTRHRIGVDHILFESDYPHGDGTWPDTQEVIHRVLGDLPAEEIRKITHENAAHVYRHSPARGTRPLDPESARRSAASSPSTFARLRLAARSPTGGRAASHHRTSSRPGPRG